MRSFATFVALLVVTACAGDLKEGAWRLTVVGADDGCDIGLVEGADVLADLTWDEDTLLIDMNNGNIVGATVDGDTISYVVDTVAAVENCDLGLHIDGQGVVQDPAHFTLTEVTDWYRDAGQCDALGLDLPCTVTADFEAELVE